MNSPYTIVAVTLLVVVAAVAVWGFSGVSAPLTLGPNALSPTTTNEERASTTIKIALLDTAGEAAGTARGCDRVVLAPRQVPATAAVLTAAMQALFAEEEEQVDGYFNFIARTNDTLRFVRAEVALGVARIYLTGELTGMAGVCDDPRAQIQIEETAMQFATVQKVEIYLNGTKTNLTPSQR